MSNIPSPNELDQAIGSPARGSFFTLIPCYLTLEDGTRFIGRTTSNSAVHASGELVFNTGMTGYVETLTDPSYDGQLLTFTSPIMGNYGVQVSTTWESDHIHAGGVIMNELTSHWSHTSGIQSLAEWLTTQKVPFITDVDTRAITKIIRSRGPMAAIISRNEHHTPTQTRFSPTSISTPITHNPTGRKNITLVDCGIKRSIITSLTSLDLAVHQVPYDFDYSSEQTDGIVLSNGPGDPTEYPQTIAILKQAQQNNIPIFGICLGAQLMALAAGAKTYKLAFGHRGHNQPVIGPHHQASITSQNHGYAIQEDSLPSDWSVTYRNLNDRSVEGISHNHKPFFAVQFHPEATPGPTDTAYLFKKFEELL